MRWILALVLAFLLACSGGALNALTPALPVTLPADARAFDVNVSYSNGVSRSEFSASTEVDAVTVQGDFEQELTAQGWEVVSSRDASGGVLRASKGDQSLDVTFRDRGSDTELGVVFTR